MNVFTRYLTALGLALAIASIGLMVAFIGLLIAVACPVLALLGLVRVEEDEKGKLEVKFP